MSDCHCACDFGAGVVRLCEQSSAGQNSFPALPTAMSAPSRRRSRRLVSTSASPSPHTPPPALLFERPPSSTVRLCALPNDELAELVDITARVCAASTGANETSVLLWLDSGGEVDAGCNMELTAGGATALQTAEEKGHAECVHEEQAAVAAEAAAMRSAEAPPSPPPSPPPWPPPRSDPPPSPSPPPAGPWSPLSPPLTPSPPPPAAPTPNQPQPPRPAASRQPRPAAPRDSVVTRQTSWA